jgi:hypothetical protein
MHPGCPDYPVLYQENRAIKPADRLPFQDFSPPTFRYDPVTFSLRGLIPDVIMDENDIPDATKWLIASRLASRLPVMYDIAFRKVVGDAYDGIEQDIWIETGKEAKHVADAFKLPVKTAHDLANTYRIISKIFFSPDYNMEHIKIEEDRSVVRVSKCPFIFRELEMRGNTEPLFSKCLAFSISAIENLNPDYSLRFVRSMCMGDKACEMKIVKKETLTDEKKQVLKK